MPNGEREIVSGFTSDKSEGFIDGFKCTAFAHGQWGVQGVYDGLILTIEDRVPFSLERNHLAEAERKCRAGVEVLKSLGAKGFSDAPKGDL